MGGVTFDACHNEAGIRAFATWAKVHAPEADVLVALSGRDPSVLEPFCGQGRRWFTVAARHPKATSSAVLASALSERGERVEALDRDRALAVLRDAAGKPQDAMLAFGSIYAMGPLRDQLDGGDS
jgi:folylpolyglutamate synthase/dihydropteroate synthase